MGTGHLPKYFVADISTAHITREDAARLDQEAIGHPPVRYPLGEYGWLINVEPSDWVTMKELGYSDALLAILMRCKKENCSFLRLDRDGPTVEGLTVFDW